MISNPRLGLLEALNLPQVYACLRFDNVVHLLVKDEHGLYSGMSKVLMRKAIEQDGLYAHDPLECLPT